MSTLTDLGNLTLIEALAALDARDFSTVELTRAYLSQIERLDDQVNAVVELNPEALDLARHLDDERARGEIRGPLHGIPILLKDNIDTGDRMSTTAGSLALAGSIAPDDAFVVKQLRRSGALILGKTNLSEWANMRSSRSSTGWSSRGGQTANAFDSARSPGGSSAGSGVATALGMCAAALGTETDGSVVIPASMNSLVGIKPSIGLVSRTGIIPISHTQDTAGPIARTVRDAAVLLSGMIGADGSDSKSIRSGTLGNDLGALDAGALRGARVGIDRTLCGSHEGIDAIIEQSINALRDCGAEVVDGIELSAHKELSEPEDIVLYYELKSGLNAYLKRLVPNSPMRTLNDLIDFNINNAERVMPYFGQEHFISARATGSLQDPEYLKALSRCKTLAGRDGIDAALTRHRLDVLFAPTIGPAWPIDKINGDHRLACSSSPAAVAGYPHISVPGGFIHGLPVGVSFYAGYLDDVKIVQYAYAFEQQTQMRRVPPLAA